MRTKVFYETFKGHDMFAIWAVDDADQKVGQFPVFSFGLKKAAVLSLHAEELKQFVEQNSSKGNDS